MHIKGDTRIKKIPNKRESVTRIRLRK